MMKPFALRLLTLLLSAALLLCAMGCTPAQPPDDPSTEPTPPAQGGEEAPTPVGDDVQIVANGASAFRVVRGDLESTSVRGSMMQLLNAIEQMTGVRLTPVTDYDAYDESIPEIIVGAKNNRPAAQGVTDDMTEDAFVVRVVDGNLVIAGNNDASTAAAVQFFCRTYLSGQSDTLTVNKNLALMLTMMDWQLMDRENTETLKTSYSDYIDDYDEDVLIAFDEGEEGVQLLEGGRYAAEHAPDGYDAARWDLTGKREEITRVFNAPAGSFSFDASDKNAATIRLWLYVSDPDAVFCDHDPGYGIQKNQATFYFRAVDKAGRTHCWNHTITNPGWHEIELSFNIHNGTDAAFDYANVSGFWMAFSTYDDVIVMVDDLRGVTYQTDYIPEAVEGEENPRLISDGEYHALDGVIVQEWYGASYDKEDKVQGLSSIRNCGDGSVNDFRTIIANLDIAMDHSADELVFHMKLAKLSSVKSILIELNEVQDKHEYEASFTIAQLQSYGLSTEDDTWSEVRIPLSAFARHLGEGFGETVQLKNFRFVASAAAGATFDLHIDHIYLAEK